MQWLRKCCSESSISMFAYCGKHFVGWALVQDSSFPPVLCIKADITDVSIYISMDDGIMPFVAPKGAQQA